MIRLSILAAPLAATFMQSADQAAEEPTYFSCTAAQTGAFGHIWYTMNVPVDGSPTFHRIQWQSPERSEGVRLVVSWNGWAPAGNRFEDRAWTTIRFMTASPGYGRARIELRRGPGERYPGEFAYAGPFVRPSRWPGMRAYESSARWGEIKAWMNGSEGLTVALVRSDGEVVSQDQLTIAALDLADAAIAAVRPEVDAMASDYRNRCQVPEPIIVT